MACRKTEVSDILESAGFSKANPYYVVQQGKVGKCVTIRSSYSSSTDSFLGAGHVAPVRPSGLAP